MLFGDILRNLLEERNLSQKQFAEELKIAPSTLGNYIRNLPSRLETEKKNGKIG